MTVAFVEARGEPAAYVEMMADVSMSIASGRPGRRRMAFGALSKRVWWTVQGHVGEAFSGLVGDAGQE